jgi:hypothetical protein
MSTRSRFGRLTVSGLPYRVCEYFKANPDAQLDGREIEERFGMKFSHVSASLSASVRAGLLARHHQPSLGARRDGARTFYTIGPALGTPPPMEDDDPPGRSVRPAGTWERNHTAGRAPAHWLEGLAA